MASLIDENTVWPDSSGAPIVNGYIYVGTQNLDPVSNPVSIYSDRELTVALSNPQRTDANGRSVNKIWVGVSKYSLKVEDENNVQQYLELDNGEIEQTGISLLTNVSGTNTITAEGAPAIESLVDNQQYNFRAANANTGAVTLQIDLTSAKTIKKQHDVDLASGDIEQNQTVSVIYNATDDTFELVSNTTISGYYIAELTDHANTPTAGFGEIWVKDDAPNVVMYTDDDGNDYQLNPKPVDHVVTATPATSGTITLNSASDTIISTKTGQMVHVQGFISISSVSSPDGPVQWSLPYVGATLTENADSVSVPVHVAGLTTLATGWYRALINAGNSYFTITESDGTSIANSEWGGGDIVSISFMYTTD